MTRDEVIKAAGTWTANDLQQIAFAIVALDFAGNDPETVATLAIFKQRYAELAGKPFDPTWDRLLYESEGHA